MLHKPLCTYHSAICAICEDIWAIGPLCGRADMAAQISAQIAEWYVHEHLCNSGGGGGGSGGGEGGGGDTAGGAGGGGRRGPVPRPGVEPTAERRGGRVCGRLSCASFCRRNAETFLHSNSLWGQAIAWPPCQPHWQTALSPPAAGRRGCRPCDHGRVVASTRRHCASNTICCESTV